MTTTIKTPDWEQISNANLLLYFLKEIQNGTITGTPRKKLVRQGLIEFSRSKKEIVLTQKALDLLGSDYTEMRARFDL